VAVAENRVVEVPDVFAAPALEDWWEVARELGFAASVSLPLVMGGRPEGALTFYFRDAGAVRPHDRHLLRLVADQLSATAEKAHLIEDLQRANALLRLQNVELEARYREAEEARRLKGELLANVSHELRTPLTAILGYTYLLRDAGLGERQAQEVRRIEDAGTQLLTLIEDLLDLTNLQLGRLPAKIETCDAVALLRAAMSAVEPPPHLAVRVLAPDASVPVRTDGSQVVRILRNLLSNAYKFTPQGAVTVRVRMASGSPWTEDARRTGSAPHEVRWEVEDTGIGIADEDRERIFDEFRQVDGSATRRFGGVGVGLALSRQLARRLGGDVTVRSEPGRGSTFALSLPAGLARPDLASE
jgi:signal transduction histidine kinase